LGAAQSFTFRYYLIHVGIAAFARQQPTEQNPIAKNRDSLPTNGDSLQRLLVASEHQMLYNNSKSKYKFDLQQCLAAHFESRDTANFSGNIKSNCFNGV
jgi:hypothetical protein